MRLTGCETWTRKKGAASQGGKFYPFTSLSECLKLCIEQPECVAVDVSAVVCVVHTDVNHTATTFDAPGYAEYRLDRTCQPSTQATSQSTHFGNCLLRIMQCITAYDEVFFYIERYLPQ